MLPLKDTQPTKTFPFVTILLILVNSLIFFDMYFTAQSSVSASEYLASFYYKYGFVPSRLFPLNNLSTLLTFITSLFLHGSFMHLAGNMLFLWIFGNNVEDYFGHLHFTIFYLISGIFASLFQAFTMGLSSNVPIIGASGAIAGIMGSYFLLYPRSRIKTLIFIVFFITLVDIPAPVYLIIWFLMQLYEGFTSFGAASGVAFFAHIGGFLFGYLYTLVFRKNEKIYYI